VGGVTRCPPRWQRDLMVSCNGLPRVKAAATRARSPSSSRWVPEISSGSVLALLPSVVAFQIMELSRPASNGLEGTARRARPLEGRQTSDAR
jgi:hypothetical protein